MRGVDLRAADGPPRDVMMSSEGLRLRGVRQGRSVTHNGDSDGSDANKRSPKSRAPPTTGSASAAPGSVTGSRTGDTERCSVPTSAAPSACR